MRLVAVIARQMPWLTAEMRLSICMPKIPEQNSEMTKHFAFLLAWLVSIPAAMAVSSDPSDAGVEFFEKKIRPILAEYCHKCHSHKAEKLKAGLYLDSRDGFLKGGDTGVAVALGEPDKSRLIEAIRYKNPDLEMPPKEKLPDEVIALLRTRNQSRRQILPGDLEDGLNYTRQSAALKKELIDAEREFIFQLLRDGKITDEARRRIEYELDLEEASVANRGKDSGGWI